MQIDRRHFLAGGFGATVLAPLPLDLLADPETSPPTATWDSGQVQHLLPTVGAMMSPWRAARLNR